MSSPLHKRKVLPIEDCGDGFSPSLDVCAAEEEL